MTMSRKREKNDKDEEQSKEEEKNFLRRKLFFL